MPDRANRGARQVKQRGGGARTWPGTSARASGKIEKGVVRTLLSPAIAGRRKRRVKLLPATSEKERLNAAADPLTGDETGGKADDSFPCPGSSVFCSTPWCSSATETL